MENYSTDHDPIFPIRLIELKATMSSPGHVCFTVCPGWDFHVISHTWSMEVRDLSTKIGRSLGSKMGSDACVCSYEEAFRNTDLRGNPGYDHLMEFLKLISNDGVEKVWLDALCINQIDTREKDREICNMAAYYNNSTGCYVCVHGFGLGYDLWRSKYKAQDDEIEEYTPRWFTRVWTLQEYILPKVLTFIFTLKPWLKTYINGCIRNQKSEVGLCKCCTTLVKEDLANAISVEGIVSCCGGEVGKIISEGKIGIIEGGADEPVLERNAACLACRTCPLVRNAGCVFNPGGGETLYFVDREAYMFLLTLAQWSLSDDFSYLRTVRYRSYFSIHRLLSRVWGLLVIMERDSCRYSAIIDEVSQRNCSVEEDHILGILGLLRVNAKAQLRTGKKLSEQIVDVLKCCSHDVVIEMCAVDNVGSHSFTGMSWVPELTMNYLSRFSLPTGGIRRLAEVVDVSEAGILTLSSRILYGMVVPQWSRDNEYMSLWKPISGTSLGCMLWLVCTERSGYYSVRLKRDGIDELGTVSLYKFKRNDSNDHGKNQKFPMWITLLGDFTDQNGADFKLAMCCSGKSRQCLYKIGLLSFPFQVGHKVFQTCSVEEHSIGGFAEENTVDYMTSYGPNIDTQDPMDSMEEDPIEEDPYRPNVDSRDPVDGSIEDMSGYQ